MDELLTKRDLAEVLRISVKTLDRWRGSGKAPPEMTLGRGVRWRQADVDAWLAAQ